MGKLYQKGSKQQKIAYTLPKDLITRSRFEEIVKILDQKLELTKQELYLYGYSLLRTQRILDAFVVLWPLAQGNEELQQDCRAIAEHVFKNENFPSLDIPLSEKKLHTLVLAGRSLVPYSEVYLMLKKRLFDLLWQKKDYETLERILKSFKKEITKISVENLSKLVFFQYESKLTGNMPAFVSQILTGAACLIARDPTYHNHVADGIHSIANEVKQLFFQLKPDNRKLLDEKLFTNFIQCEATILTHILPLTIKNNYPNLGIIPTPYYLITHDAGARRVSPFFLPWLTEQNKELAEIYNPDIYHYVLWAVGAKKASNVKNLLKNIPENKLHPYLRLALMLRATTIEKASLKGIVLLSDFENVKNSSSLFKDIAVQTVKSIIAESKGKKLSFNFLETAREFFAILPVALITDENSYFSAEQTLEAKKQQSSILSQENAFEILNVSHTDSKPMIMQKVMKLAQQFPEKMAMYRKAQSELFNPAQKLLHQYVYPLILEDEVLDTENPSVPMNVNLHEIPLRHELLNGN